MKDGHGSQEQKKKALHPHILLMRLPTHNQKVDTVAINYFGRGMPFQHEFFACTCLKYFFKKDILEIMLNIYAFD